MVAKVLIKRTSTPNSPPVTLDPGELAVEMDNPLRLWVGVPTTLDATGKKQLVPSGGSLTISDAAPATPAPGDLWWESDTGNLWLSYQDADSQQWVQINSGGGGGSGVGDAPIDGKIYGRLNGNWSAVESVIPPAPIIPVTGNWTNIQAQGNNWLVLPPGGTWAWWAFSVNTTSFGIGQVVFGAVNAGGTSVLAPLASSMHTGAAWRIA